MAELLLKISYTVFQLKVIFSYSAVKVFYIYNVSILISAHANCIDIIYTDLGGLVV